VSKSKISQRSSLGHKMMTALQSVFKPGKSRHEDKKHGRPYIRGIDTMETMTQDVFAFARYVKANWPDTRQLNQVMPEMAQRYIAELMFRELTGGYIGRVSATLRKLDIACRRIRIFPQDAPPLLPYASQGGVGGFHSTPSTKAYAPEDAERIITHIARQEPQVAVLLRVMLVVGLRVTEATYLRVQDIDPDTGRVMLLENANRTKGGKPRVVEVPAEDRDWLVQFRERGLGTETGHLFEGRKSLPGRARKRVRAACKNLGITGLGTHGFRKTLAAADYQRAVAAGADDRAALLHTSRQLGHNRAAVAAQSYVDGDIRAQDAK